LIRDEIFDIEEAVSIEWMGIEEVIEAAVELRCLRWAGKNNSGA
jgi:hypothetical protein